MCVCVCVCTHTYTHTQICACVFTDNVSVSLHHILDVMHALSKNTPHNSPWLFINTCCYVFKRSLGNSVHI